MLKRIAIEGGLFLFAFAVGLVVFVAMASYHDRVTDGYWSVHGVQPPPDYVFRPDRFMGLILFGPWMLLIGVRLVVRALWHRHTES